MQHKTTLWTIAALLLSILIIFILGLYLEHREPILLQGTIECTTYRAASKIAGRIERMYVRQGDKVEQGELLYTLSTPELDARLMQAEAARSAAEALDKKALAGARRQQIEAARNMWQKAEAGLQLAKKSFLRIKGLYEQQVLPAQKFDEAQANYQAALATERAARAEYDLALAGATIEDKQAAAAQVRQASGVVSEVESYLNDARVYAPITGEVADIIAEQGELVGSGYPVVAIIDRSDVWAAFNIKESLLPHFLSGTRFTAHIPALKQDIEFEVYYISAEADFATWNATRTRGDFDIRTFEVKARPISRTQNLRPGMSVIVNLSQLDNKAK